MHLDHLTLPLFSAIQVMESLRMPFTEAIQHVQSRRCCIHISEALHNQLREFETIYQNRGVRSPRPRLFLLLLFSFSDSQTCFAQSYSLRSHERAGTRRNEHSNQGKIIRCSWSEAKRLQSRQLQRGEKHAMFFPSNTSSPVLPSRSSLAVPPSLATTESVSGFESPRLQANFWHQAWLNRKLYSG